MKKTKKTISVYSLSGDNAPASYYRVIQYIRRIEGLKVKMRPLLSNHQFGWYIKIKKSIFLVKVITEFVTYFTILLRITFFLILDTIKPPDIVVLSKVFIPRAMPWHFKLLINLITRKSLLIWDFDDHIIDNKQVTRRVFEYLSSKSHFIVVTHEYLKSLIADIHKHKVILMPTTDGDMKSYNMKKILEVRQRTFKKKVILVWVATPRNMEHLERIIPILDEAAMELFYKYSKQLVLKVVCSIPLKLSTDILEVENIKWSRRAAIETMIDAHIGIMPLLDNTFTKGKGAFKLIQYLSIGLPVLASNVGYNKEVVINKCGYLVNDSSDTKEWKSSLLKMVIRWEHIEDMSHRAREVWTNNFSFKENYKIWKKILLS